jgi:hypothetical protein
VVEEVEEFGADLDGDAFGGGDVLEQPVVGTVDIAGPQLGSQTVALSIEQ